MKRRWYDVWLVDRHLECLGRVDELTLREARSWVQWWYDAILFAHQAGGSVEASLGHGEFSLLDVETIVVYDGLHDRIEAEIPVSRVAMQGAPRGADRGTREGAFGDLVGGEGTPGGTGTTLLERAIRSIYRLH